MTILLIGYLLTWAFIPFILLARKRPVSTLAWIWAVVLFPFVGPIAYLLFGVDRITRPRRRQHRAGHPYPETAVDKVPLAPRDVPLFRAIEQLSGFAVSTADELRLLPDAAAFYPALERRIAAATHHVHAQFFVWEEDAYGRALRDALITAARRGVIVRVLVDRIGCFHTGRSFFEPLVAAGGSVEWFRSLNPLRHRFSLHLRNHRKLQIIDGNIAFVGGMNVGKDYAGENPRIGRWRDLQLELQGPVVAELQRVFAEDWEFAAEQEINGVEYFPEREAPGPYAAQIVLGGPDLPVEAMADSFAALLHHASQRVWISVGYFVPDSLLLSALRLAAARGVDVRLLGSERSDHPWLAEIGRSYYTQVLRAKVRVFEFKNGLHHAKSMLIDDRLVMIGSANCDNRSMRLNFELNVLADSPAAAEALEAMFREDFAASREIILEEFRRRPFSRRFLGALVRPLAPMA